MMKRIVWGILGAVFLLLAGLMWMPRLAEWCYLARHKPDSAAVPQGDGLAPSHEGVITPENTEQLRLIEQRGWGSINDMAWAPDSRSLAMATSTGVRLVETGSLELLSEITAEAPVRAVVFSPDGSLVAGAVEGKGVALWRPGSSTFDLLLKVNDAGSLDWVRGLQFSGNGRWLTVTWRRALYIWEVQTGRLMRVILPVLPEEWAPMLVDFSPGEGRLREPNKYQLYTLDEETGEVTKAAPQETRPESEWAAVASEDCGQLNLYTDGQDTPRESVTLADSCLLQVSFSVDGQQLAALAADGTLKRVTQDGVVEAFEPGGQANNYTWNAIPMRFSPDGQYLAWVAAPWALNIYRTADGSRQTLRSPWAAIQAVHLETAEQGLMIVDEGEQVSLAPISLEERLASWEGDASFRSGHLQRAGFSADGRLVWLWQGAGCMLWETEHGRPYGVPLPCGERTAISPNGDRLAVVWSAVNSGDPSRVVVYRTRDGRVLNRHYTHQYSWRSLQFSPDGRLLVAASAEGERVYIWAGGLRVFRGVGNLGWDGRFTPDGLRLISSGWIVNLQDGGEVRLPDGEDYYQTALSPDGRIMARRNREGTIELWDTTQYKRLRSLTFLPGAQAVLTFSADGSRLLVVVDGVMAFWGVEPGPASPTDAQLTPTVFSATPSPVPPSLTPSPLTPAEIPTPSPTPVDTEISPIDGMVMSFIPAGTFQMGSEVGTDDEQPVHMVTLDAFWIDQTEITNGMYEQCVAQRACDPPFKSDFHTSGDYPYYGKAAYADYPVVWVEWNQAVDYCTWAGRRLPTEAEWEYAALGGRPGMSYPGLWHYDFDGNQANFCDVNCKETWASAEHDDGYADTAPVRSYPANEYGLYDMAGNVWEWVADWCGPYSSADVENPRGPDSGELRVFRGGAWVSGVPIFLPAAMRGGERPDYETNYIGFRCARTR